MRIITISRQYGSGGRQIGTMLAEQLGIELYDKRLFAEASRQSGIDENFFERAENTGGQLLAHAFDSTVTGSSMTLNERMFVAQSAVLKDLAQQHPCILLGCGGNEILKNRDDTLHIFIYADFPKRLKRVVEEYGIPAQSAERLIRKVDKGRSSYLKTYTGCALGSAENYHLCINSGTLGIENAVKIIGATYRTL